ncbi:alpha-L-fucosidase [Rhodocytophaga rosea]|uniref:alpha-L-fucosidase n=1 Tax=Rhodocytophaga rosea TaxID=2704465 RepID=A0A6C0GV43_9BACT|nr:alpha-L-fucosidase [Rhodocytophaga rosea]QHT71220.1 alpha-L-fucosidase [Rhodocytophaga rosea]
MQTSKTILFILLQFCLLIAACNNNSGNSRQAEATQTDDKPLVADSVKPSPRQLAYQRMEMIGFAHFTVNTFTDKEWGEGTESPAIFNPTAFDAKQWVQACKDAGIKQLILTAKHHDGFCLWPSKLTEHSVKNSPWKNGKGDVVKEVSDACQEAGLKFGVYLSPWDRHEPKYGTAAYNDFYKGQLRELLTNYGEISEVWLDGAKGENAKDMTYDFLGYWKIVRELQPNAVLFSDEGPDVHWIGNEKGFAGETKWSKMDTSQVSIGTSNTAYLNSGDPNGSSWVVGECDVSIRPGWFYHPKEDDKVKSVEQLLDIYYKSVGRNGVLLLNIPPDRRGLFHENDVARLKEFKNVLDETFKTNLAANKSVKASNTRSADYPSYNLTDSKLDSYWATDDSASKATLTLDLGAPTTFDRILLGEGIEFGQRVNGFTIEAIVDGLWTPLAAGTTIGYKRLLRFDPVTVSQIRLTVSTAGKPIVLSEFGVYKASSGESAKQ